MVKLLLKAQADPNLQQLVSSDIHVYVVLCNIFVVLMLFMYVLALFQ